MPSSNNALIKIMCKVISCLELRVLKVMAGKKGLGPKWTFDVLAGTRQTKHIGKIMRNYAIYCLLTSFSCAREGQIDWFCFMYQRRRELRQVEGGGVFKFGRAHCVIFSLFFCLYKNKNQQKIVYYFI